MTEDQAVAFVPDIEDNRDRAEEDQVWAEILPMTGAELRGYHRALANVKAGSKLAFQKAENCVRKIMSERVLVVHNYEDIKGVAISDGAEVYERGETAMVDALYSGLTEISTLKEGTRKK
ncbi:MAG: hypothetical protein CL524_04845 [Aequorivita sp.]|nr:hypothetical protein [Aequorivita sp.]